MVDLAGTSCTIGDVTFDFGGFNSDFRFVPVSGVTVSFLESKPTAVAFTLSDNFGISVPQDGYIHIDTTFGLSYSAQLTQPDLGFSGLGVAVSDIMMSAPPTSGGTRFALTHCLQAFCPVVFEEESGGAFESSNGVTSFSSALQETVAIPDVILMERHSLLPNLWHRSCLRGHAGGHYCRRSFSLPLVLFNDHVISARSAFSGTRT